MSGWETKAGIYYRGGISDEELWMIFNRIISNKSHKTTSYKFAFIKALIENTFNLDSKNILTFDEVFFTFTNIYWNLVVKYDLKQYRDNGIKQTGIEKIINSYISINPDLKECYFDNLRNTIQDSIVEDVKKQCKKYVIGAIYENSDRTFYDFSIAKGREYLKLNKDVIDFFKRYLELLLKLNHYSWAQFLEGFNNADKCNQLLSKLDESSKRTNLSKYNKLLYQELGYQNCFYCNKHISDASQVNIDHYVPWCFIRNDKLWNFVVSCKDCNIKEKKDRIPSEKYIRKLKDRNRHLMKIDNIIINNDFRSIPVIK